MKYILQVDGDNYRGVSGLQDEQLPVNTADRIQRSVPWQMTHWVAAQSRVMNRQQCQPIRAISPRNHPQKNKPQPLSHCFPDTYASSGYRWQDQKDSPWQLSGVVRPPFRFTSWSHQTSSDNWWLNNFFSFSWHIVCLLINKYMLS